MQEKGRHMVERIKKQVVAGFIIYRRTSEGTKFLLLYRRGMYWNFPKGHFEPGEKTLFAAVREVEEETGLKRNDLRIIPGFRTTVRFRFFAEKEEIRDTMILFLAETRNPHIVVSPREHSGFAWFLYPDAMRAIGRKYVSTKRALKYAHDFIRKKSIRSSPKNSPR